ALRAHDGNADGALMSCRCVLVTARSLGDEPLLISLLIRLACRAIALDGLERTLAQGQPAEAELKTAQLLLQDEAAQPLLVGAMRGERAGAHRILEAVEQNVMSLEGLAGLGEKSQPNLYERIWVPLQAKRAHPIVLRTLTEGVTIAELPEEQQFPRFAQ